MINAVISVVAAGVLFKIGLDSNRVYNTTGYPQAFGAAGGTIGTGAGALAALLFMLLLFSIYWPVVKRRKTAGQKQAHRFLRGYLRDIFIYGCAGYHQFGRL